MSYYMFYYIMLLCPIPLFSRPSFSIPGFFRSPTDQHKIRFLVNHIKCYNLRHNINRSPSSFISTLPVSETVLESTNVLGFITITMSLCPIPPFSPQPLTLVNISIRTFVDDLTLYHIIVEFSVALTPNNSVKLPCRCSLPAFQSPSYSSQT